MEFGEADDAALLDDNIAQVETRRGQGRDLFDEIVESNAAGREDRFSDGPWPMDKALAARFEKQLVLDRNVRFADRMVAKLIAEPKRRFFFAVGAQHMVGEHGIVAMLRARGYTVTRLPATAANLDEE